MERYGFSDYVAPGDIVGHTLGGYEFDHSSRQRHLLAAARRQARSRTRANRGASSSAS